LIHNSIFDFPWVPYISYQQLVYLEMYTQISVQKPIVEQKSVKWTGVSNSRIQIYTSLTPL